MVLANDLLVPLCCVLGRDQGVVWCAPVSPKLETTTGRLGPHDIINLTITRSKYCIRNNVYLYFYVYVYIYILHTDIWHTITKHNIYSVFAPINKPSVVVRGSRCSAWWTQAGSTPVTRCCCCWWTAGCRSCSQAQRKAVKKKGVKGGSSFQRT